MKKKEDALTFDLMVKRLTIAETKLKTLEKESLQKDQIITDLKKKNESFSEMLKNDKFTLEQFTKMKNQLESINKMFIPHGFTIEDISADNANDKNQKFLDFFQNLKKNKKDEKYSQPINKVKDGITFGKIVSKINELNEKLEKEQKGKQIVKSKNSNMHKLGDHPKIQIGFFQNGLKLHAFPFMNYESRETQQILIDFLEGFYPTMLEKSFPDGVLFEINDKLDVVFDIESDKMSKKELLDKLPKSYIKDGVLVNPRALIEKHLNPNQDFVRNEIKEDVLDELSKTMKATRFDFQENSDESNSCKLKIRDEQGLFYYVNVTSETTFDKVLSILEKKIKKKVILSTVYPKIVLEIENNGKKTMKELDLYPQSLLHMKIIS